MEPEIFKMKTVGRVGNRLVGPEYMYKIRERAKQLESVSCKKRAPGAERQLRLPGV